MRLKNISFQRKKFKFICQLIGMIKIQKFLTAFWGEWGGIPNPAAKTYVCVNLHINLRVSSCDTHSLGVVPGLRTQLGDEAHTRQD